jgi:eukaryotic-like serine/threonine-protein kinase
MLQQLGKYEILRALGQGAMGEVYLAHQAAIGREVAIKTILSTAGRADDMEERFRREAAAAGKLNHPNIVTIYDFDREGELLYLVMEYVQGEDLEDIIAHQSMTPAQFLEVLAQVCDGLGYAHRHGVIHRDIKPSNIRVVRDGKRIQAKVMDFGIARTRDSHMTVTGMVMGTVSYMAPEYIQTSKSSAQGDLWAVGVMLYECLTTRKPFGGDNTTTILFNIVSQAPDPIEPEDAQGISPSVHLILDRALSKDPANRYQTAEEFGKALRACKDPSWKGVIEATVAPSIHGPTTLMRAQAGRAASFPEPSSALTALAPPDPDAPTASAPSPAARERATKPGSHFRYGISGAAALGLVVLVGIGTYLIVGRKSSAPTPVVPTSTAPPAVNVPAIPPSPPVTTPPAMVKSKTTPPVAKITPLPVKPPEETLEQKRDRAIALIETEPARAVPILRELAAAQPGDARIQGHLLAALYRSRDANGFERALDIAKANGLTGTQMMQSAPLFRMVMVDEQIAHKTSNGKDLLSEAVIHKVAAN